LLRGDIPVWEELQPAWLPERYRLWYRWALTLTYGLTFSLIGGGIFWLTFGIVSGLIYRTPEKLIFDTTFGLLLGFFGGVIGGLTFGQLFRHSQTIHPAEIISWSWPAARKGLVVGLPGGLGVGLGAGLLAGIIAGPRGAFVLGGVLTALIGLVGGLAPRQMPERFSLSPNEGIWRSGRRGLIAVLLFAVILGQAAGWIIILFGAFLGSLV
jgi:hypothetical protein